MQAGRQSSSHPPSYRHSGRKQERCGVKINENRGPPMLVTCPYVNVPPRQPGRKFRILEVDMSHKLIGWKLRRKKKVGG